MDYGSNFMFVQHVLSMDTVFPDSTLRSRAISAPALHHAAYALIIAAEWVTAVLCWMGAAALLRSRAASADTFHRAKRWAVYGLVLGFLLWQVGFMTVGGEWFAMWQSQTWNGVNSAFRFVVVIGLVLVFVCLRDDELA